MLHSSGGSVTNLIVFKDHAKQKGKHKKSSSVKQQSLIESHEYQKQIVSM